MVAKRYIEFRSPFEILADPPSEEGHLIGERHLTKGSVCIVGGAPGVGKSRTSISLAIAGATRKDWFGHSVHRKFKTMILQSENGPHRLYSELKDIEGIEKLSEHILISNPPAHGIQLDNLGFREQFSAVLEDFQPDVIVLDPWNAITPDDKARDFRETFDNLRSLTGVTENDPALVIIHHTRKPKENEKHSGRALLNLFAGSYIFGSVARSAFILQAATDDPEDDRVVMTCCKNNDGELGERSVWHRRNGLFAQAEHFDWKEFDKGSEGGIPSSIDKVQAILKERTVTRNELVSELQTRFGMARSTAYGTISKLIADGVLKEDLDGVVR